MLYDIELNLLVNYCLFNASCPMADYVSVIGVYHDQYLPPQYLCPCCTFCFLLRKCFDLLLTKLAPSYL